MLRGLVAVRGCDASDRYRPCGRVGRERQSVRYAPRFFFGNLREWRFAGASALFSRQESDWHLGSSRRFQLIQTDARCKAAIRSAGHAESRAVRGPHLMGARTVGPKEPGLNAFDAHHPPSKEIIDTCVHCGFCLPTCPTYVLWYEEMDSPRGRIYLIKAGLEGRTEMTPSFVGHFDACLGCMACVTACPSGVQYAPLIEATRGQIERRHSRSLGDRWFRSGIFFVFPYPARL